MFTKFYQNRMGFVEDMTKTFWCVFSVHSVVVFTQYAAIFKRPSLQVRKIIEDMQLN